MLARRDYITPILWGKPWLEKPALYYWRAMFSFREFGVHDWSARLPSATFAFILVTLIYLHIRRFRRGGQLDAALITASCAGIIAFARGASTDMQLAAPFCIGMLGWYAWYETDSKFWLFDLYFFVGAATLAKGPVAPFLAMVIIVAFAALRREWAILRRTIWWPGVALYLAMVLPWFIAVQHRNPNFLKIFFWNTISSASPPAVSSTNTSSGSISPLSFWRLPPGPSSLSPPSSTLCVNPSPNGRPVAPNTTTWAISAPAMLFLSFSSSGRLSPSSFFRSPSPNFPATFFLHPAAHHPHRRLPQ